MEADMLTTAPTAVIAVYLPRGPYRGSRIIELVKQACGTEGYFVTSPDGNGQIGQASVQPDRHLRVTDHNGSAIDPDGEYSEVHITTCRWKHVTQFDVVGSQRTHWNAAAAFADALLDVHLNQPSA